MTYEEMKKEIIAIINDYIFSVMRQYEKRSLSFEDMMLIFEIMMRANSTSTRAEIDPKACKDAISRQVVKEQMIKYGFLAPDMTVTEFVEDLPHINPQEIELKYCDRNICVSNEYNGISCDECEVTKSQKPKTGYCKDCKWWKDSDGTFKRGIGAESQCPINRKEVYEGNGYCYMFEPQENEDKE